MKKIGLTLGFMLAPTAVSAADPVQFDLVCQGIQIDGLVRKTETPFTEHIRIDLRAGRWCKATCFYINDIKATSADEIVLDDKNERYNWNRESLDRRTGTYTQDMAAGIAGLAFRRTGSCEVSRFSGFPARRF